MTKTIYREDNLQGLANTATWFGLFVLFWITAVSDYWNDDDPMNRKAWRRVITKRYNETFLAVEW